MNVLVVSHLYPRPLVPGMAAFIGRQVVELSERGVRLTVLSPVPWVPPFAGICGPRIARAAVLASASPRAWISRNTTVHAPRYFKLPGRLDFGLFGPLYSRTVMRVASRLHARQPFDLVHGQMLVPDGYAAVRFARTHRLPVVISERGYLTVMQRNRWQRRCLEDAISGATQCVFVSHALLNEARSICDFPVPPCVVYTGVDHDIFSRFERTQTRQILRLTSSSPVAVCVARVEPTKQPFEVLHAFRRVVENIPNAQLYWLGEGSLLESLRQEIRAVGLGGNFHCCGQVEHGAVPLWLAAADIVVLASRNEGLPNSLVEAAAAGRAVVATAVGGIPEVVVHGETGLLVPCGDTTALCDAMIRLLADRERSAVMGEKAGRRARAMFSWSRHADEMLQIYREAIVRHTAGGPP